MAEMAENRFRPAKTFEEKEKCVASAIPKSTGNIKTNGRLEFWNNVCGIRRFMEEKNANLDFYLLDASDKRCSSVRKPDETLALVFEIVRPVARGVELISRFVSGPEQSSLERTTMQSLIIAKLCAPHNDRFGHILHQKPSRQCLQISAYSNRKQTMVAF